MNKKINQLSVRTAVGTDLTLVGDPTTGTSYKTTINSLPLVPYTGATGAVNLGAYDLTVNSITVGRGLGANINNTVVGSQAGASFTTAQTNVAIGEQALKVHSTGNANTAVGRYAMLSDVDGEFNTALGTSALVFLASGVNTGNTAIGVNGLGRLTTGSYNTWLGYTSAPGGILTSGSFNTIIGGQVNVGVATLNNNIILADGQGNIRFRDDATSTILSRLAGTGTRMVVSDANGALSTQAIPSLSSGGSSVNYYLNGSVNSSVAGYKQLGNTATIGAGTDFTLSGNGLIAQFLTDAGNPNRLEIPGGAWNFEMFFQVSSSGGSQKFYVELLKYDGTTFTSIASSSAIPEQITGGTAIDLYLTSLAVPTTTLLVTDRLAIRVYIVDNSGGRTITLHTEDNTLCEIITTFAGGISALNGLTANTQYFATGTSGTDFGISSVSDTHTFNLPTASGTNRGALSSADWTTFNNKQAALTLTTTGTSGAATLVGATLNIPQYSGGGGSMAIGGSITSATAGSVLFAGTSGVLQQDNANLFWDDTNNRLGIGTATPTSKLELITTSGTSVQRFGDGTGNVNFVYNRGTTVNSWLTMTNTGTGGLLYEYSHSSRPGFNFIVPATIAMGFGIDTSGFIISNSFSSFPGTSLLKLFAATGNLVIQNGGTFADAGYRLDVNGTARVSGQWNVTGSTTAASGVARGANYTPTLVAAANGNVLVGLDVNPSFTNGAFTGLSNLAARFTGNVLMGIVPPSIAAYTYVPLTLSNNAIGALKVQLSLVNGGGSAGAGSAIDFYTYTDQGNGNPGLRIAGVDDGNFSGNFQIFTKAQGSSGTGALSNKLQMFGGTGNLVLQNGGTFTDAGYRLDVNGTARVSGDFTIADTKNIILAATTGTKIGTATSQKLSFWNATPIVQPTTGIAEAAFVENLGGSIVNVDSTFAGYTLQQITQALKNMGALA